MLFLFLHWVKINPIYHPLLTNLLHILWQLFHRQSYFKANQFAYAAFCAIKYLLLGLGRHLAEPSGEWPKLTFVGSAKRTVTNMTISTHSG